MEELGIQSYSYVGSSFGSLWYYSVLSSGDQMYLEKEVWLCDYSLSVYQIWYNLWDVFKDLSRIFYSSNYCSKSMYLCLSLWCWPDSRGDIMIHITSCLKLIFDISCKAVFILTYSIDIACKIAYTSKCWLLARNTLWSICSIWLSSYLGNHSTSMAPDFTCFYSYYIQSCYQYSKF